MEKKVPKVWEKIILKIYWSLAQVYIKEIEKVDWWYHYKWELRWRDENNKSLDNPITIEWFMDEYGNYWD